MPKPIVYLNFANDPDAHLQALKQEHDSLYALLQDKPEIELRPPASDEMKGATVESIFNTLDEVGDRVIIFHYAGHANSQFLRLQGQHANAKGLASRLVRHKNNLKVVILNGCSTQGQVKDLLAGGIPAVIATLNDVPDSKANDFSRRFYTNLKLGNTLEEAYNHASDYVLTTAEAHKAGQITYRTLMWDGLNEDILNEMPWVLYVHDEHTDILNWQLPQPPNVCLIHDWHSDKDTIWAKEIIKRLEGLENDDEIRLWHYDKVLAGENIETAISQQGKEADIFLFLVSTDSMHHQAKCKRLMEEGLQATQNRQASFIPVMIRTTSLRRASFKKAPYNSKVILEDRPLGGTHWVDDREAAYVEILDALYEILDQ